MLNTARTDMYCVRGELSVLLGREIAYQPVEVHIPPLHRELQKIVLQSFAQRLHGLLVNV